MPLDHATAAEPETPAAPSPPGRTTSDSRQFLIFGDDVALRSRTARQVEEIKRAMNNTLRIRDTWQLPILVNLDAEPPPRQRRQQPFNITFLSGEGENLRIQIDVFNRDLRDSPELHVEVVRAMLLELSYRGAPPQAGRNFQFPPDWLVEAVYEKFRTRTTGPNAQAFSTLLAAQTPPELRDFLRLRPESLDTTSRTLYRAQAAALLDTILELPDGRPGLHQYISAPRRNPATIEEIASMIPSLEEDRSSLGRRWLLAIARASAANRADLLGSRETGRELDQILEIKALPDPRNPEVAAMSGPYALEPIARSRNGRFILTQLGDDLMRLSIRAHPMYSSLVREYLQIVRELASNPRRRVDRRIAAAEEIRAGLRRQHSEVESFLDWVEATQLQEKDETLVIAITEAEEMEAPPPRADAISRHIDAIAERGW